MKPILLIIRDSVVDSAIICKNGADLEKKFLDACELHISNFDKYNNEDKEAIMDNGYEEFGTGNSICMTWAEETE